MGRSANDHGKRAPDTGSKKKFDINRQQKESTGKYNYTTGKKERDRLKAGKQDIVPKVNLAIVAVVVVVVAMGIAGLVYFLATVED
mmetsp:Transcript_20947/g.52635  ORF Transcript_20947/g.52635 Transcript_20947/m.52635 type:complete len:86 (-) Transcript_20947:49-306(-)